ncbi:hypothetical protein NYE27_17705 [Paenibacillus sp. FSL R10-2779]|uniref:hypothetical protein n=1 Tax=Paenibacillus sp. FSL R10-2779 TaxID=2975340 RepID=UPI0030FBB411
MAKLSLAWLGLAYLTLPYLTLPLRTVLQLNCVFGAFFQSNELHSTYSADFAAKRSGYGTIAASESERSGKRHDFVKLGRLGPIRRNGSHRQR